MTLRHTILALALLGPFASGCTADAYEEVGNSSADVTNRAYFKLFRSDAGDDFYFNLHAANHEVILSSEGYSSRTSALNGLLSVANNGLNPELFDIRQAQSGDYYFNLLAYNHQIIGSSEMYSSKSAAQKGAASVTNGLLGWHEWRDEAAGARFDVFQGKSDKYYFNLHAKNGAIVLSSQSYKKEASALNGTFSVFDHGVDLERYEIKETSSGSGYYFNLKASNGQVIATSEIYSTKGNATRAIEAIAELLPAVELL